MNGELREFVSKKAYELSYALLRIADGQKDQVYAEELTRQAYALLSSATERDYGSLEVIHNLIESFLRLGCDTNRLSPLNLQVILGELKKFKAAVSEASKEAEKPEVDLERFFTVQAPVAVAENTASHKEAPKMDVAAPTFSFPNAAIKAPEVFAESGKTVTPSQTGFSSVNNLLQKVTFDNRRKDSASVRQASIMTKIREAGNCRLKEVLEHLPDVSERTVRYDLQSLIERGLVERIGNGGPATYYRTRNF